MRTMPLRALLETATEPLQSLLQGLGSKSAIDVLKLVDRGGPGMYGLFICAMEMIPFVPCGPIAMTAGLLYGTTKGLLTHILGQEAAALGAFLVGRLLVRRALGWTKLLKGEPAPRSVQRQRNYNCTSVWRLQAKLVLVLDGMDKSSFRRQFLTFLLLRQSPLVPFSICNYTVGALTRLPLLPYALGTLIGCIPGNLVWVSVGAAARAGQQLAEHAQYDQQSWVAVLGGLGMLATTVLLYGAIRNVAQQDFSIIDEEATLMPFPQNEGHHALKP
mmetsp:Transcript_35386/g.67691  ORF Transcript_35386/g.67691 Transcript_35386/m.67691 type:complete len:274 (-) Transcript_35386:128-949(-)